MHTPAEEDLTAPIVPVPRARWSRLRVVEATAQSTDVMSFILADPTGADLPPWTPGAHVDLFVAPGMVRQYSLCGDPADRARWRIAVLRAEPGRGGSRHLHEQVRAGSLVAVGEPRNNFPLAGAHRYLFIAGGIGITPLLPMIRTVAAQGADWTLWYGGRRRERMAFLDELAPYGGRVDVWPEDERGPLPLAEILQRLGSDALLYCCGPEALLTAVEREWGDRPPGRLHMERFQPRPVVGAPTHDQEFDVFLERSGRAVRVRAHESLLDVLSAAGVEVPWSCGEGTCGSCETGVLAGDVDHRDSVLSRGERMAGRTMMVCVSRARSPWLTLDL
ncbi:PDR/VanB family oxidoreductase [Frankia sp. CiP3]|uniref:PDR/VanB family oxidoreductase n=1 Tax=Frankia sp. CiP3 TaxID=2880971 RepID=UPI001EF3E68A|nr:PDR/VanB family oxidoreductase [Frankia sp. CiP3]